VNVTIFCLLNKNEFTGFTPEYGIKLVKYNLIISIYIFAIVRIRSVQDIEVVLEKVLGFRIL